MTYPVSDEFADRRGRWNYFAPWDATEHKESADAFLDTQEHVDIRSFRAWGDLVPVPQYPDLDIGPPFSPQSEMEEPIPQTDLENKILATATEKWRTVAGGTGIKETIKGDWDVTVSYSTNDIVQYKGQYYQTSGSSLGDIPEQGSPWSVYFIVGKIATRGGWCGLQVETNGSALNVTLESCLPGDRVNISEQDVVSLIFPDYNDFTAATSWFQLTSDPDGEFGNGKDSAQVPFSDSTTAMPEMRFDIADFAATGFELNQVTGVRIHLQRASAPVTDQTITIMAIRALQSTWAESWIDFDTRWGIITRPVTLDGDDYAGTTAQDFEFVRGDGSRDDPIPESGAYTLMFYPGGETNPPDAADPAINKIAIIMREIKDDGAGTGSALIAELTWNDVGAWFEAYREDTTGGSPGSQTQYGNNAQTVSNDPLDPTRLYAYTVKIVGKTLSPRLLELNRNRDIVAEAWIGAPINEDLYTIRNGRVGFIGALLNRDAWIETFASAPTDYATLRTPYYYTRTPVDGVRLSAEFSPDANLFQNITSEDAYRDQTKTVSGEGSFRTAKGLTTNQFIADDFTEMYLDLAIWVPQTVTPDNQPLVKLLTGGGAEHNFRLPNLQAAQWNHLHFDMGVFRNLITGVAYTISVLPASTPINSLGFFWVDSIKIGRRKVAWSVRAQEGGQFRRFKGLVNTPDGAVHFNPNERGTALQLQADALTPDAWILSPPKLFPRYAELGLPVFDQVSTA